MSDLKRLKHKLQAIGIIHFQSLVSRRFNSEGMFYSLSRKTVNARGNFWNVYCFATNQMRDETAKDN